MAEIKKIATRESYGNALKELASEGADKLVVLDADLSAATKTGIFKKAYPNRHFNCGIAESNMMCVAAGLSTMGLVPFASSFAMFAAGEHLSRLEIQSVILILMLKSAQHMQVFQLVRTALHTSVARTLRFMRSNSGYGCYLPG